MSIPTFPNYIDGGWVSSGATFENRNPANTEELIGFFPRVPLEEGLRRTIDWYRSTLAEPIAR